MAKKITRPKPRKAVVPVATRSWLPAGLLVLGTILAYLPMWHAGFIWDDDSFLVDNPIIKAPDGLYQFWCTTNPPDYFPLTSTTLWLEWRLWGMNAVGYHIVNVLLHTASSLLLWRILVRLKIPGGWLAAAIFAVHPVNVESVAWITERKNTLSMFFYVWTLFWYLRFEDTGRKCCYGLGLVTFTLALLSKTAVAPLPFVLLGLAWWRRGMITYRDFRRIVPFFILAGLLSLITIWFQYHRAIGHDIVRTDSFWSRLAASGWAVWFYLYKVLWPVNLMFVYPRWHVEATEPLAYLPGLLLMLVLAVCWHYRRQWSRPFLFALGYFVVMLLPVLGLFNIYFMRYSLVADHWQYFSILGLITLIAAGLTMLWKSWGKANLCLGIVLGGALLLTLGTLTWKQSLIYANIETLWQDTLAKNPACWMAHNNLGVIFDQKGQADAAISHYQAAIRLKSDFSDAYNNLGFTLDKQGRTDEAIRAYQEALRLEPDDIKAQYNLGNTLAREGKIDEAINLYQTAIRFQPDYIEAHNNLGIALDKQGKTDAAIREFQAATRLNPEFAEAHNNLGNSLAKVGQTGSAIFQFQEAIRLNPNYALARDNLGIALDKQGKTADAIAQFQEAIRLNPNAADPHIHLGVPLAKQGRTPEAIFQFQEAIRLNPNIAEAHYNLGKVFLNNGQVDAAIAQFQETIRLKPDFADAYNNLGVALAQQNQIDAAITQFQDAIRLKPDFASARDNLTRALQQKGGSNVNQPAP